MIKEVQEYYLLIEPNKAKETFTFSTTRDTATKHVKVTAKQARAIIENFEEYERIQKYLKKHMLNIDEELYDDDYGQD